MNKKLQSDERRTQNIKRSMNCNLTLKYCGDYFDYLQSSKTVTIDDLENIQLQVTFKNVYICT